MHCQLVSKYYLIVRVNLNSAHLELLCEVVGDDGGERGEEGGQKHTHVADVNGDVEEVHHMIEEG